MNEKQKRKFKLPQYKIYWNIKAQNIHHTLSLNPVIQVQSALLK